MTRLQSGSTIVEISSDPVRPAGVASRLFQPRGRYSDGRQVIYTKSLLQRNLHRLRFPRVDDATLSALRSFLRNTTEGTRRLFTWTDPQGVARTVRFAEGELSHRPIGPDRHEVELRLEEDIA